jgi:hypothetical protein
MAAVRAGLNRWQCKCPVTQPGAQNTNGFERASRTRGFRNFAANRRITAPDLPPDAANGSTARDRSRGKGGLRDAIPRECQTVARRKWIAHGSRTLAKATGACEYCACTMSTHEEMRRPRSLREGLLAAVLVAGVTGCGTATRKAPLGGMRRPARPPPEAPPVAARRGIGSEAPARLIHGPGGGALVAVNIGRSKSERALARVACAL